MVVRRLVAAWLVLAVLLVAIPVVAFGQDSEAAGSSLSRGTGVVTIDQRLAKSQAHASLTWDRLLPPGCLVYQTANPVFGDDDTLGLRVRLRLDLDAGTFSAVISGETGFGELGAEATGRFRVAIPQGQLIPEAGGHGWTLRGSGHATLGYFMRTMCVTAPEDSTPIERIRRTSGGGAIPIEGEIDLDIDTWELELSATQGTEDKQFRLWISDVEIGEWEPEPAPEPSEGTDPAAAEAPQADVDAATPDPMDDEIEANSLDGRSREELGKFLLIVAMAGGSDLLIETLLEWTTAPYERYLLALKAVEDGDEADADNGLRSEDAAGPDHPDDSEAGPPDAAPDGHDESVAPVEASPTEPAADSSFETEASESGEDAPGPDHPDDLEVETSGEAPDAAAMSPQPASPQYDDADVERVAAALLDGADEEFRKRVEDAAHARRVVLVMQALLLPETSEPPTEPATEGPAAVDPPEPPDEKSPVGGWLTLMDVFVPGNLYDPSSGDTMAEQVVTNFFWRAAHRQASTREGALVSDVMGMLEEDEWVYADKVKDVILELTIESNRSR